MGYICICMYVRVAVCSGVSRDVIVIISFLRPFSLSISHIYFTWFCVLWYCVQSCCISHSVAGWRSKPDVPCTWGNSRSIPRAALYLSAAVSKIIALTLTLSMLGMWYIVLKPYPSQNIFFCVAPVKKKSNPADHLLTMKMTICSNCVILLNMDTVQCRG